MSIRGKDRWESRFKRHLWWHANRDWIQLFTFTGAAAVGILALAHFA